MSQSVNRPSFVIIGIPGSRRIELFQTALAGLVLPPARIISYLDVIENRVSLDTIPSEAIVRIESPGKDFETERALLTLGADCDDPDGEYECMSRRMVQELSFEKGLILPSRQWYLGYGALLRRIEPVLTRYRLMNMFDDILLMFDKRACHAWLVQRGIAVPKRLPPINSYDELIAAMREQDCRQVFIKLAHGSSASGVVAYRTNGSQHQAVTTVEMVESSSELRLYNSRQLQTHRDQKTIAKLVDALCRHRVHVEEWIPKANHNGQTFDLRIVMIAGKVRHTVVRMSRSPITNLHLLNERAVLDDVLPFIGDRHWAAARQTCEQTAAAFSCLYSGIDLAFAAGFRKHAVLEVNAFGDLLPGTLDNDEDTYTAEIQATLEGAYDRST